MKTKFVSLVIMASMLFAGYVNADNVDLLTAKQIGAYYFNVATGTKAPVMMRMAVPLHPADLSDISEPEKR